MDAVKPRAVSQKTRFEVFKRDKFTCQYCGKKAPDVLLECDHIEPHSKGGSDHILNLITACEGCNAGKGDRRLTDEEQFNKARRQLEELEEKRQQLEMMAKWHKSLMKSKRQEVDLLAEHFAAATGTQLNDIGKNGIQKLLKRFSFSELCEAIETAANAYVKEGNRDSVELAFEKIGGVAGMNRLNREDPERAQLHYCKGIGRKRFFREGWQVWKEIEWAYNCGVPVAEIKHACLDAGSWSQFKTRLVALVETRRDE